MSTIGLHMKASKSNSGASMIVNHADALFQNYTFKIIDINFRKIMVLFQFADCCSLIIVVYTPARIPRMLRFCT